MFRSLVLAVIVLILSAVSSEASLIISEILADPPAGLAGDANADGIGSTTQDEFVEFFNDSAISFNISNWFFSDAVALRHVFPSGTILGSHEYLVVFGGGTFVPDSHKQKSSTGTLSLNNTGDSVRLFDSVGSLIDEADYGSLANHDQSIVRASASDPFALHSQVPFYEGKIYSPGYGISNPVVATPEPHSVLLLSVGSFALNAWRRRKVLPKT